MNLQGPLKRIELTIPLVAGLLLGACGPPQTHQATLYVFGTLVEIEVAGLPQRQADALIRQIQQDFQQQHQDWHAWQPGLLEDLNRAIANSEPWPIARGLAELLIEAAELERLSQGTFNPGIGNLIRLWGFHTSDYPVVGPPPKVTEIEHWVQLRPSMSSISIQNNVARGDNPAVRIDLGGIAKGAAIDQAIVKIRAAGAAGAIVNAGGDLRAFGSTGARPWRVAIRQPGGNGVLGSLAVRGDEAIFTSGNYHRFRQGQTRRYAHIIDPRNGWPVDQIVSATVVADNGTRADAAATALVVAGPEAWREIAASMRITHALLVDSGGCVSMTDAMRDRLTWTAQTNCKAP